MRISKNKIKMALCLFAFLFVCSCGESKQNPPENLEQKEVVEANPLEEAEPVVEPDTAPPVNPTESATKPEEHPIEPVLTVWPDADTAAIEAYRAILQENAPFVDTPDGESFDIAHLKEMTAPYVDYPVEADSFSLVDLDHDGTPELILSVPIGADTHSLILRYEDSIVYSFIFSGRAFNMLKKTGTFWASGGATESGICAITFSKDQHIVDEFTYCTAYDRDEQDHSDIKVKFFVNHKEVSEADWDLAVDEWKELPYADWYECVDENIDAALSLDTQST